MLFVHFFLVSLQINQMVPSTNVQHILRARAAPLKVVYTLEANVSKYTAHIVSTKLPDTAIMSLTPHKLHIFLLYNTTHFSRCVWDGNVGGNEKTAVVKDVVNWLRETHKADPVQHGICNEEDAQIFEHILDEDATGP